MRFLGKNLLSVVVWVLCLMSLVFASHTVDGKSCEPAFQKLEWSHPLALSDDFEISAKPILIGDNEGRFYAFWESYFPDASNKKYAIMYSRYENGQWATPLDVVTSPSKQYIITPRAALDQRISELHLVFVEPYPSGYLGGWGRVYYTKSKVENSMDVRAWSTPIVISEQSQFAEIRVDDKGSLHIVYSSMELDKGICHKFSEDGGKTWHLTGCISSSDLREDEFDVYPLFEVQGNNLYVVWMVHDYSPFNLLAYPTRAIRFSFSDDNGYTWKNTYTIDEVESRKTYSNLQPNWPSVLLKNNRFHLIWVSSDQMYRYYMYTDSYGVEWSKPELALAQSGHNGWMGMVEDDTGTIYFASATIYGVAFTSKTADDGWSQPLYLGDDGPSPHYVDVALSGAVLMAVWQDHGGNERTMHGQLLYSTALLPYAFDKNEESARSEISVTKPSFASTPMQFFLSSTPTFAGNILATRSWEDEQADRLNSNSGGILILSTTVAVIFVAFVIIWSKFRHDQ